MRKYSAQDSLPVWRYVLKAPELRGGGFEAKANFGSAALLLTEVHDPAVLFFSIGDIPQDKPFAQSNRLRQSNETTMSTKDDSTGGICEWNSVGRIAMYDHRQLCRHSP
jgi:hypothetical protein